MIFGIASGSWRLEHFGHRGHAFLELAASSFIPCVVVAWRADASQLTDSWFHEPLSLAFLFKMYRSDDNDPSLPHPFRLYIDSSSLYWPDFESTGSVPDPAST
ncbi:hypothetical protein ACFE04_022327 [Oxalis oulophora]